MLENIKPELEKNNGRNARGQETAESGMRAELIEKITSILGRLDSKILGRILIPLTALTLSSGLNETASAQDGKLMGEIISELLKKEAAEAQANKQKEQRLTPDEATVLIETVTDESDSNYYDNQEKLISTYNKFPDNLDLRAQAWAKMYPKLAKYANFLAKISDYNKAFRFFTRDLEGFVSGFGDIPTELQDDEGNLDEEKLVKALEQAIDAVDFVDTPAKSQMILSLIRLGNINLFSDPAKVKEQGWDKFANRVSNEHQASFLRDVIFKASLKGQQIDSPSELEQWLPHTSWINSQEKLDLLTATRGEDSLERLSAWREFIEKVCKPIPLIKKDESAGIEMGVNQKLFKEIESYLYLLEGQGDVNEQLEKAEARYNILTGGD